MPNKHLIYCKLDESDIKEIVSFTGLKEMISKYLSYSSFVISTPSSSTSKKNFSQAFSVTITLLLMCRTVLAQKADRTTPKTI